MGKGMLGSKKLLKKTYYFKVITVLNFKRKKNNTKSVLARIGK